MTATDEAAFYVCFGKLARVQGGPADPATMRAYFEVLQDLPLAAVESAALTLARTTGEFFPKSSKWHEVARMDARAIVERYVTPGRAEPWHYECEDCHDTGWRERWIEQGEMMFSQHSRRDIPAAYRHQVAEACVCRATNRTYQRAHVVIAQDETPVTDAQAKRIRTRAQGWTKPGA